MLLFFGVCVLAQIEKKNIAYGEFTLADGSKLMFRNLEWKNDKAYYQNAVTWEKEELFDASIISIEEKIDESISPEEEIPSILLYRPDYPEGVYATKQDFMNKKPSSVQKLTKRGLYGFNKKIADDETPSCFFFTEEESRLRNVFAVVYNGILYFNVKAILANRNKYDRAQESDFPNSFVRVLAGGNNYLYTEADLVNAWVKGLANSGLGMGAGGAIGGAIQGAAKGSIISSSMSGKGVVWDFKNEEFNIFKNCNDYNDFIKDISEEDIQKCERQQADIMLVRTAIEKIK